MTVANLGPLDWRIPIVTPEGRPTQEFQQRWATQISNNSEIGTGGRETLEADRTYYVSATGSDNNDGLTVGTSFLTIQKAVDVAATLDCSIFNVTIQVADGTYTQGVALRTMTGSGVFTIIGNPTTPGNCIVSTSSADCFAGIGIYSLWTIDGFKVQTTSSGYGIRSQGFGSEVHYLNIDFGACATAHMLALSASLQQYGPCTISGSAPIFIQALREAAYSAFGAVITITGTPNFSVAFASVSDLALVNLTAVNFIGSATGKRYAVSQNATIVTGTGGNPSFLPGNVAGTVANGGLYDQVGQTATSSQFGLVKVDGTTITETGGVISASGSGGIGFRDAINTGGSASGSAFASKGNIIVLTSNIKLLGISQTITTSGNYSLYVVVVNGSNVITSVLGNSTPMAVTATSVANFKLSTPLNITSGTRVGLIITRTGGAATDVCGVTFPVTAGSGGWGFTWAGSVRYASAAPTVGDSILYNTTESVASTVTYSI